MVLISLHYPLGDSSVSIKVLLLIYVQHSFGIHPFNPNDYSDEAAPVGPGYYNRVVPSLSSSLPLERKWILHLQSVLKERSGMIALQRHSVNYSLPSQTLLYHHHFITYRCAVPHVLLSFLSPLVLTSQLGGRKIPCQGI